MRLEITSFADAGNHENERLVIKAQSDLDIGDYLVLYSATSRKGGPVSGRKSAYWFPDGLIEAGDLIVVYTKAGTTSTKELSSGRTAHFYYWGLDKPLWGDANKTAVILRVSDWTYKTPD
ncbi:MAG: hypothetical protein JO062_17805 [Bryobacterales bacterium]|nr:hypothetical protein [Acidobacteriota bacterium]MBV9399840.1 hypothetical protein [Bryobacterales bacterium]